GAVLGGAASAGKDEKAVTLSEKDDKSKVKLTRGTLLVVKLPAQSGTGYLWEVSKRHATQLKEVGKPDTEKPEKPLPGGPVLQVFRFRAEVAGSSDLAFVYRRPFDKADVKPARTFQVSVQID